MISNTAAQWVLGKFSARLVEHLPNWGVQADIAETPTDLADINHHLLYYQFDGNPCAKTTLGVTHVDDFRKQGLLKTRMSVASAAICWSSDTARQLATAGIDSDKICFIPPAHDNLIRPRRIRIAITTRVYSDGRKREDLLIKLADEMSLEPFHFEIIGDGWDRVVPRLLASGAEVSYEPGNGSYEDTYGLIQRRLPECDYYLYPGLDEGSLGTLDALAAGVKTITTPQGFHLDLPGGITFPFWDFAGLAGVFRQIAAEQRERVNSVAPLSWAAYAQAHAEVWRNVLDNRRPLRPHDLPRTEPQSIPLRSSAHIVRHNFDYFFRPLKLRLRSLLARHR